MRARRADWHLRLSEASDAGVIEASLRDPVAFAALFDRHAPVIHRYAARRVGDTADDIVASTFIAAFSLRARYDLDYSDARPWLYGIASIEIARHLRAEQRAMDVLASVHVPAVRGHAIRVADDVTAQGIRRELDAALSNLAPGDRDALLLFAWEELTYEEVARALAIPIGTVRSRLHRARAQLRVLLGQLVDEDTLKEVLANE